MLESIYGAFDTIAERRGVFKVEVCTIDVCVLIVACTVIDFSQVRLLKNSLVVCVKPQTIGDCYVGATGLPMPQSDHAVIAVRFARDCLFKLSQVTNELALALGEDTNALQIRVGLHSGPTTAGVLRGIKGRFQLFGDTVNMASRMESTGVASRIQLSQATANALEARGKSHWIVARQDRVEAKGKGSVQTYFVVNRTARTNTTNLSAVDDTTDCGSPRRLSQERGRVLGDADDDDVDMDSLRIHALGGGESSRDDELTLVEQQLGGYLSKSKKGAPNLIEV